MHLPYTRTLQEYQTTLNRYLRQAAKIKAVKAVYQFGSIGAPGLSDIDLALIVDERITHKEISKLSIRNLCADDQETFLHEPTVVTEQAIDILFETYYIKNLARIYGENFNLEIQRVPPNSHRRWALTLEYAPLYIFCIQNWLAHNNVDVRSAIPLLRSIRYLLELNSDLKTRFNVEWEKYADNVNFLCDNWFDFSENESAIILESVLEKAWKIVANIAWACDAELINTNQFTAEREMWKPRSLAYSANERAVAKKEEPTSWRNIQDGTLFSPIPQSCLLMLDVYRTTGGLLAKFMRSLSSNCWSSLQPETEFESYLAKRARLINKHIEFLGRRNVDFGYAVTNFVFRPWLQKKKSIVARSTRKYTDTLIKIIKILEGVVYH
jgi:hypothetical protein